jgi:hypothetical protein
MVSVDFDLTVICRDLCIEYGGDNDDNGGSRVADNYDGIVARWVFVPY